MFYGTESRALTCAEARRPVLSVGRFVAGCSVRLLDLATMAQVLGSSRGRAGKKGSAPSSFTHAFAKLISEPIAGANVVLFTTQADVYNGSVAELDDEDGR